MGQSVRSPEDDERIRREIEELAARHGKADKEKEDLKKKRQHKKRKKK